MRFSRNIVRTAKHHRMALKTVVRLISFNYRSRWVAETPIAAAVPAIYVQVQIGRTGREIAGPDGVLLVVAGRRGCQRDRLSRRERLTDEPGYAIAGTQTTDFVPGNVGRGWRR